MIPLSLLNSIGVRYSTSSCELQPEARIIFDKEPDFAARCREILLEWEGPSLEEREKSMTSYLESVLPEYREKALAPAKDASGAEKKQAMLAREYELLSFLSEIYENPGGLAAWVDQIFRQYFSRVPDNVPAKKKYGCIQTLEQEGPVLAVSSFPDGRFVTEATEGRINIWSPRQTPEGLTTWEREELVCGTGETHALHALPNGHILSAGKQGVLIWKKADGGEWSVSILRDGPTYCVRGLPDGSIISGSEFAVGIWTPDTVKQDGRVHYSRQSIRSRAPVRSMHVLPGGRVIVGLGNGEVCTVSRNKNFEWKMRKTGIVHKGKDGQSVAVNNLQVLSDWEIVTSPGPDGSIIIWNSDIGFLGRTVWRPGNIYAALNQLNCMLLTRAGRLFVGEKWGALRIWQLKPHMTQFTEPSEGENLRHDDTVTCMELLSDGRLISGSQDGCIKIWDGETVSP